MLHFILIEKQAMIPLLSELLLLTLNIFWTQKYSQTFINLNFALKQEGTCTLKEFGLENPQI